jgi:hypothetical protein
MRNPATPTIDQLLVLLTVAEAGSFTAAAKRLGRATYSVKPSPLTSADRSEHPTASANQLPRDPARFIGDRHQRCPPVLRGGPAGSGRSRPR